MPKEFVQTSTESKKQLREARKQDRSQIDQDKFDLIGLCNDPRFLRFLYRIFDHVSVLKSIWHPNGSELNYRSGKQDVGHWLWEIVEEARPEVMAAIMAEHFKEVHDGNRSETR